MRHAGVPRRAPAHRFESRSWRLDPSESDSEARPYAPVGRAGRRPAGRVGSARVVPLTPRVQVESEDWIGAGEAVSLRQAVHLRHAVLNQYLEATLDGAVRPLPAYDARARTRPLDPPCPSFCLL
jgi:hypothetical protein